MYSLHFYGRMLADAPRMDAYAAALRHMVKSDSVVMDLGSGPGVFALLACKLGARRVYVVEPENVIRLAREAVAANGFADRVEFFENRSTEITFAEPASIMWDTVFFAGNDESRPKVSFNQSTFFGVPLSTATLRAFSR